ncbi:MAG: hypothetical protein V5B34_08125 [Accumulibacter sp.]
MSFELNLREIDWRRAQPHRIDCWSRVAMKSAADRARLPTHLGLFCMQGRPMPCSGIH